MAQKDPVHFSANVDTSALEAEAVKESIKKKELQNLILRKLIKGIKKPCIPDSPEKLLTGPKK